MSKTHCSFFIIGVAVVLFVMFGASYTAPLMFRYEYGDIEDCRNSSATVCNDTFQVSHLSWFGNLSDIHPDNQIIMVYGLIKSDGIIFNESNGNGKIEFELNLDVFVEGKCDTDEEWTTIQSELVETIPIECVMKDGWCA